MTKGEKRQRAEVLIPLLSNPSTKTRTLAAYELSLLGPSAEPVVPILLKIATGKIEIDDPKERKGKAHPDRVFPTQIWCMIDDIGPVAFPLLKKEFENSTDEQKSRLLKTIVGELSRKGDPEIERLLRFALNDRSESVRVSAVDAASYFKPQENIFPTLFGMLSDDLVPDSVRSAVAGQLGKFGDAATPALPIIVRLLQNPQTGAGLRFAAIAGLASIGAKSPEAVTVARQLLQDNDPMIEIWAIEALGKNPEAVRASLPELLKILAQPRDPVSRTHQSALQALIRVDSGKEGVAVLLRVLEGDDASLYSYAIRALGQCGKEAERTTPLVMKRITENRQVVIDILKWGDGVNQGSEIKILKVFKADSQLLEIMEASFRADLTDGEVEILKSAIRVFKSRK